MIKSQNKHGPLIGTALGIKSNRGSPPYGGVVLHSLLTTADAASGTAVTPLIVIVKPPGRSFQAMQKPPRKDLVCGRPVKSHSGLPEQRPRPADSTARCTTECATVEHITKDAVRAGLCIDKTEDFTWRRANIVRRNTHLSLTDSAEQCQAPSATRPAFYATNIKELN